MGQVLLYATLRPRASGDSAVNVVWSAGDTIGDVIRQLVLARPGLQGYILDEQGGLVSHVNVFLDGRDVRYLEGLDTALDGETEIAIFPPVAGG